MLPEKYAPKTSKELIGNRLAALELTNFLKQWKRGQAALLSGEPGVGKTLAARLVASELGYEIVEIGADQERGRGQMQIFSSASKQAGLISKKKLFLVDETDQMESTAAILQLVRESAHPVVLITNDPYDRKLYPLRQHCKMIKFQRLRHDSISKFLLDVCKKDGIDCDPRHIEQIAKMAGGDARAALIDLEAFSAGRRSIEEMGYREQTQNIFETLKIIFKTSSLENAFIALNNAEDGEELHRWVAENIADEYDDLEDIARAYDAISKADIFYSRIIRRQSWSLQKYFFELSAGGVALAKQRHHGRFVKYTRPQFRYRKDSEAAKKIARKLHVSSRKLAAYRHLIQKLAKNRKLLEELGVAREDLKEI